MSFAPLLTLDIDSGHFLSGLGRSTRVTLQESLGPNVSGQDMKIGLQLARRDFTGQFAPLEVQDNLAMIFRIMRPGKFATTGRYKVTYGGETTDEIRLSDTIFSQQCAINGLASIKAAGGVDLLKPSCDLHYSGIGNRCRCVETPSGTFQVVFRDPGARSEMVFDPSGLLPQSIATVRRLSVGTVTDRELLHIEFPEQMLAQIDANEWTRDGTPKIRTSVIVQGDSTTHERQRVWLDPDPAGGVFGLRLDNVTTGNIAATALAVDIEQAFAAAEIPCAVKVLKVDRYAWDIEFLDTGNKPQLAGVRNCLVSRRIWRGTLRWNTALLSTLHASCPELTAQAQLKVYDLDTQSVIAPVSEPVRITRTFV